MMPAAPRPAVAALPMYDLPELRAANDSLWQALAGRLTAAGIAGVPPRLAWSERLDAIWRDPSLLLGQTCGYPLTTTLKDRVRYVATPRYRVPGCPEGQDGTWHRSAVVVAAGHPAQDMGALEGMVCAVNGWDSNTGMNLLRAAVAPFARQGRFFGRVVVSGAHAESLRMVAEGAADVAAVDCVTLAHLARHRPALVEATRVMAVTEATPCLPLVCAVGTDDETLARLRAALDDVAADPALAAVRDALMLDGFAVLDPAVYRIIPELERHAAAMGYPDLA